MCNMIHDFTFIYLPIIQNSFMIGIILTSKDVGFQLLGSALHSLETISPSKSPRTELEVIAVNCYQ